jgi:hypothetical protein
MGVLLERKAQVIFVTASSVEQNGKAREVIVESRPQYAVVQLNGSKEKYPIAWEMIYELAKERHAENLRLEALAQSQRGRIRRKRTLKWLWLRYLFLGDFLAARFDGFAEELVAGTTSPALFWPIALLLSCAPGRFVPQESALPSGPYLRQIGPSLDVHERSDVFYLFWAFSFTAGGECRKYTGIAASTSRNKPADDSRTNPRTNSARGSHPRPDFGVGFGWLNRKVWKEYDQHEFVAFPNFHHQVFWPIPFNLSCIIQMYCGTV